MINIQTLSAIIKKVATNKIIIYLFSRYGTYILQFIVSLAIAGKLGPFYMGVYGLVQLVANYMSQFHFGISHSLNVLLVHHKQDRKTCDQYTSNSIMMYIYLVFVVFAIYFVYRLLGVRFATAYDIDPYLLPICFVVIFEYFKGLSFTILRVRNKVHQLTIIQSSEVFLYLISVLLFSGRNLIMSLIFSQIASYLSSIIIAWYSGVLPMPILSNLRFRIQHEIIVKGVYLFLYNTSFYFILVSIRTLISSNYSVSEFGMFTFSFTIAHAVLLLLSSLTVVIFPKIIDLLSSKDKTVVKNTIEKLRVTYISSSHFLIYLALIFYPILIVVLPKYEGALTSMNLIALAVLSNANSFGYSTFLIAQNKERLAAIFSLFALLLNITLGIIFVYVFHVEYSYVILATSITYLFFSFAVVASGKKLLGCFSWGSTFKDFFPYKLLIPFGIALFLSIFQMQNFIYIPLVCYLLFNYKDLFELKRMILKLINNPKATDV